MLVLVLFQYALCVLLVACVVGFTGICVYLHHKHQQYSHIPGPKRTSFFTGNVIAMYRELDERNITLYQLLYELQREYGPVIVIFVFHRPVAFIHDPLTVKELLMNTIHTKPDTYDRLGNIYGVKFLGEGLVTERNHTKWGVRRRIFNPAFHRKKLMNLMGYFNESADKLVLKFKRDADSDKPVPLMEGLRSVTLDVIAKAAFGMTEELILESSPFIDAVDESLKGMLRIFRRPFDAWNPFTRSYRTKVKQSLLFLRKYGEDLIVKCLKDRQEGEVPDNILNTILESFEASKEKFEMDSLVDEFITFFVAGQETTSNTLGFTLLELGKRPDIAAKVKNEVDSIVGAKEFVGYEDVMRMEYTSLVLKESLRLYPPVAGAGRDNAYDITACGYKIPAGTNCQLTHYVMSRMEEFFKDPLEFDPERFRKDDDTPLYAYFPFSLGERSCIGQQFAMIEARVILAKLFQNFDFKLDMTQSFEIADNLTLTPKGDCMNYINTRHRNNDAI